MFPPQIFQPPPASYFLTSPVKYPTHGVMDECETSPPFRQLKSKSKKNPRADGVCIFFVSMIRDVRFLIKV